MCKQRKKWLALGGGLALGAVAGFAMANKRVFTVNDITTGENADYPKLRARVYYADPDHALAVAEQAIRRLPRWRLVRVDAEERVIDAEVEAPIGRFIDDVTLSIIDLGYGQSRAVIRSRSREGRGDLGQNALHIRELQGAMDDRLMNGAAI